MAEAVVEARGLSKHFGPVVAVEDLDLAVDRGEILGLLGPNGAGKTTTLRLLLGLARPTSGQARVLGGPPGEPAVLARVGAVVEEPALYPYLTGRDHLRVLARYTGAPDAQVDTVLDRVDLTGAADQRTKTYSMGMRQRLAIAGALLKDPELLVLDEPTNGLDPAGISAMRGWLRELAAEGRTILLSSHLLGEVEQICDRVAVLLRGRKVADSTVGELAVEDAVVVTVDDVDRATRLLGSLDEVVSAEPADGHLRVVLQPGAAAEVNAALVHEGLRVSGLWPAHRSLEDVFFALTREEGG